MAKPIVSFFQNLFGGGGKKITVTPVKSPAWVNLEAAIKRGGELTSLNFELIGYFFIPQEPLITSMAAYVNTKDTCYALVYETDLAGVVVEIFTEYQDGRETVFTTAPLPPTEVIPAYVTKESRPDTQTRAVFQDFLKVRTAGDFKPVSKEGFAQDYRKMKGKSPRFKPAPPRLEKAAPPSKLSHPLEGASVEVVQIAPFESEDGGGCCIDFMITPPQEAGPWDGSHLSVLSTTPNAPCQVTAIQAYDGQNFHDNIGALTGATYIRIFAVLHPDTAQLQLQYDSHTVLTLDVGASEQAAS